MPNLADFERDYWAPDREEVLASMRPAQPAPPPSWGTGGSSGFNERNVGQVMPGSGGVAPGYGGGSGYGSSGYGGNNIDWDAIGAAWTGSGGKTLQDWQRFVDQHPEIRPYIGGSKGDKLTLPDGTVIDAVYASGLGGQGATWNKQGPGGGASSGAYGGYGYSQSAPNPTPFNYEAFQAPDAFSYEDYKPPEKFTGPDWQAPTGVSEANDPGYQARLAEGEKAIERSAAARGTLLTGGTLQDINRFGQEYAANEYQNVYNRAFQNYQTDYNKQASEYDRTAAAQFQDYATSRQNAFQNYQTNYENALNAYKTNFDTKFQPWQQNYNQAYQSWLGNFNAANQGFQNKLAAENQRFGQLFNTANLGLTAAGQQAQYGQGYANSIGNMYGNWGNNQSDLTTGQGNANAAGQVGSANAWGNAYGNMANMANMYGMYAGTGGYRDQWDANRRQGSAADDYYRNS